MGVSDSKSYQHSTRSSSAVFVGADFSQKSASEVVRPSSHLSKCGSYSPNPNLVGDVNFCFPLNGCASRTSPITSPITQRVKYLDEEWDSNHNEVGAVLEGMLNPVLPSASKYHPQVAGDLGMRDGMHTKRSENKSSVGRSSSRKQDDLIKRKSCPRLETDFCREQQHPNANTNSYHRDFLSLNTRVSTDFSTDRDKRDEAQQMYNAEKTMLTVDQFQENIYDNWTFPSSQLPTWCRKDNYSLHQNAGGMMPVYCTCTGIYCNYTCHLRCKELVSLDCKSNTPDVAQEASSDSEAPLLEEEKCQDPDPSFNEAQIASHDLRQHINVYNANASCGSELTVCPDGKTYGGVIRVHMNLCRPINVISGARPPSIYDIIYEDDDTLEKKTLTSFYLPRNTVKALHITSETTTQEVISALLKKFKVVDNPHKFVLYEKYYESEESMRVKMRRLHDSERPLKLLLLWSTKALINRHFVLQENDTGDIPWEAFSLPELNNFLRILEREEDEYLNQVRMKYKLMEAKLREAMDSVDCNGQKRRPSIPSRGVAGAAQETFNPYFCDHGNSSTRYDEMSKTCPDFVLGAARSHLLNSPFLNPPSAAASLKKSSTTPHFGVNDRSKTMPAPTSRHEHSTPTDTGIYTELPKAKQLLDVT